MSLHLPTYTSRRTFLKGISVATAGLAFPNILLSQGDIPAGKKLAIGCIGVGGKGASDMTNAAKDNEIVAICDVDAGTLAKAAEKFPMARQFRDFRQMLDEMKDIDGVTISTPDHAHYPAAMHAIGLGKHVCIQKPLTNTLWEARELHKAAKKMGVITQMGNQGHTFEGNRELKEWIQAGAIGKIKEVHIWTNRPIWPQGREVRWTPGQVPANLDWELWLAGTPDHAFSPKIHPFNWRGTLEWGAGAIGDMGCHLMDPVFFALDLGMPQFAEANPEQLTAIAWPLGSTVTYRWKDHPTHGDPMMTWYEGKHADGSRYLPQFPEVIDMAEAFANKDAKKAGQATDGGWFIVGTEGVILNKGDQAKGMEIWPKKRREEFLASPPAKTLPRSVSPGDPQQEWTIAIKNGKAFPWMSQFDYSVPLTELGLIGGLAMRAGIPIEWNSEKLEVVGLPEAEKFIRRPAYRKGWEYSSDKMSAPGGVRKT